MIVDDIAMHASRSAAKSRVKSSGTVFTQRTVRHQQIRIYPSVHAASFAQCGRFEMDNLPAP